jgi:NADH-quinone oxidoreductase subunit N
MWLQNIVPFAPETVIVATLALLFVLDALLPKLRNSYMAMIVTVVGCAVAAGLALKVNAAQTTPYFSGLVINDGIATFFRLVFLFACAAGTYLAFGSKELDKDSRAEFSLLILCVTFGLSLMAIASHLLMVYIAIEIVSIVSFVMAGFNRLSLRSNEASFKYLVFGALSSGLMIYGFSLVYGATGSLHYSEISKYLVSHPGQLPIVLDIAFVLIYAGFAYKISAFPMHFWTPDVYEGAPTPVAAFFSVGPKAAGFAAILRFFTEVLCSRGADGTLQVIYEGPVLKGIALVAAMTMLVGNLSALGQTNVKRLLAYSSIAHVGYMLMGLVALTPGGYSAILFYIVAYCVMNLGAFWVVSVVSDLRGSSDLASFRGVGWTSPLLGICMAVFLFSLTGIPLFSGFIGKFLLFGSLIEKQGYLWLALFGVLNSVVSLYYYSQVLKAMWLDKPTTEEASKGLTVSWYHGVGIVGMAVPTVILGLFFAPLLRFVARSLAVFH